MSRCQPQPQRSLVLVDPDTKRRIIQFIARVGVTQAKRLIAVSDHAFDSLRYNGAVRPGLLARVRARLDEIERGEVAA